jgi:filamentous hemagglutinin
MQNAKQYVEAAHAFIYHPPAGTLTLTRSNHEVVFYDPKSNLFAVRAVNGAPKTFFKPDPAVHGYKTNLEYFYGQRQ